MSWSSEKVGSEREKAVEELIRGRDCADQLRIAMENPSINEGSAWKEGLMEKIISSFSNTLSILRSYDLFLEEVSQVPVASPAPDDSGESIPRTRRGCYKRRKHANSWSREDSPSPFDDGHSWRKYGQKNILGSNHPRNYFRCTHKYDQKCGAAKQVQKIREEPPVFRTTYYGHHTCRDLLEAPHLLLHDDYSSVYLSFDRRNDASTVHPPPPVDQDDPTVEMDSCTASSCGGATLDIFDDSMDHFAFDFC